ncbi:hypothetical protein B0F90DRAFT_1920752 [Multifurca ochricompacta]|uniref:Uncharacterized protein n=1 Tax=Multifurca ochricompacta TaxID=376703 RepID=A0AAD4LUX1_9AGAM|nr:hypothetical protein B0F90DRAFT_1920752 [Multifurca ochricompacta]
MFGLTEPMGAVGFIFRLYNLLSRIMQDNARLDCSKLMELEEGDLKFEEDYYELTTDKWDDEEKADASDSSTGRLIQNQCNTDDFAASQWVNQKSQTSGIKQEKRARTGIT